MIEIRDNATGCYLFNTVNNRVVHPSLHRGIAYEVLDLIPDKYYNTVRYDRNVTYTLKHCKKPFIFSNVMYGDEVIRTFMDGMSSEHNARLYKEDLETFGLKLL